MLAVPPPAGLMIAAPASGSGKTVLTLGILRALKNQALAVASLKAGPDYIDPAFHAAATARACENLDPWAMRRATRKAIIQRTGNGADLIICEGVMGLFDGATATGGSTADLAAETGWPVVLVVDAAAQAASAAAVVRGFCSHRSDVTVAAVIFNRVGSPRHGRVLAEAMQASLPHIPVAGYVPRDNGLSLPDRHLGLVQAGEHGDLEGFLEHAAQQVSRHLDLTALRGLATPARLKESGTEGAPNMAMNMAIPPPGQRIAVARDRAFAFCYDHILQGWRDAGASLDFFSPLQNQGPDGDADAVYLPGGYPELHGPVLSAASVFKQALHEAAGRGAHVYGECGGYMVLGEALVDADGQSHAMCGLLPLVTSFAEPALHLGYRRVVSQVPAPFGTPDTVFTGHEFHYSTVVREDAEQPLFRAEDARGQDLGTMGMVRGTVAGSYVHLIDRF